MARPKLVSSSNRRSASLSRGAVRCRRKFLRFFPDGFNDETYIDWERGYKQRAHEQWREQLGQGMFAGLIGNREYQEIAARAVRIESRTNLLFSFEKMALRDAVKSRDGARVFAEGLYDFLHGHGDLQARFERWVAAVETLPRRQTRVLTWPLITVFGFIGQPDVHMFLKPNVTRRAAAEYGYDFRYASRPAWQTYDDLLSFAIVVGKDLRDLKPCDMIDLQSFIWVQGSDEYPD